MESLWAKELAKKERRLMCDRRVLEAIEVFRTRTGRSVHIGRLLLYRFYLEFVLKEKSPRHFEYYGRCIEETIPVRPGDLITIPKGVLIHGNAPRMKGGVHVLGKTRTIEVEEVFPGMDLDPARAVGEYMNPRLRWEGSGGSRCEVDINHVLVTNSLHGGEKEWQGYPKKLISATSKNGTVDRKNTAT